MGTNLFELHCPVIYRDILDKFFCFRRQLANLDNAKIWISLERGKIFPKVRWSIYIINSLDKPNFGVSLPHQGSTTVSSENNLLYLFFKRVSIPLKSTCTHPVPIEFRKCAIVKGVKYHVENYNFVDVCAHHLFSLQQAKELL